MAAVTTDMVSWLRQQILARKARAEALPHGPWHVEGKYPQQISNPEAILVADTYTGPQFAPDIAQHIVAHDPQDTIVRCEAELALLHLHEPKPGARYVSRSEDIPGDVCEACCSESDWGVAYGIYPCLTLQILALGYRHRPGWLPEWAPESSGTS